MRKLLCLLLVLLLAMPAAQADETTIVHLSDLHYLSPTLTDGGEDFMAMLQEGDGKLTHYTPQLLRAFIAEMLALRPDAVVLSGDLTLSGALQSHRELAAQLEELVDAGIPVYVLPGNHDLAKGAYCFSDIGTTIVEGTSGEEFASMYERCGYGDALVRDEGSLSYVAEIAPGLRLLVVDVNAEGMGGDLNRALLDWTEAQLQAAQEAGAMVIGVSHQNLLEHSEQFVTGYIMGSALMLRRLWERYGVPLHLSGHLHVQHIAKNNGLTDIAASALSVWPAQYGIIKVAENEIRYETRSVDVAAWARENGVEDENLLAFDRYARDFFDLCNLNHQRARMAGWQLEEAEKEAMQGVFQRLNAPYFAGMPLTGIDTSGLELWEKYLPEYRMTSYLHSILQHPEQDSTHLVLPLP